MLGFASHSPGGLGVFDAAMLVALWQFDTEDLVAGLLLFRLLYYIMPFAISLVILGGRELWLSFAASRCAQRSDGDARRNSRSNVIEASLLRHLCVATIRQCRLARVGG